MAADPPVRVSVATTLDSVMYSQVLAESARLRGWDVHLYDARSVEAEAAEILGERPTTCSTAPGDMGPPWAKDHRMALEATVLAASR